MRNIVVPGDMVGDGNGGVIENAYVENGKLYSKVLGMYDAGKGGVVPLEGIWSPRVGDIVIGIVTNSRNAVYEVDLSYFCRSILIGSKYDRNTYKIGDVIEAIVKDIEDRKTIILSGPKPLYGGNIMEVKPTKVPRIIGKNNTMIEQISNITKTSVVVGKNGVVWLKGGNVPLATVAIRQIEEEAHTSGLTERIKGMLMEAQTAPETRQSK